MTSNPVNLYAEAYRMLDRWRHYAEYGDNLEEVLGASDDLFDRLLDAAVEFDKRTAAETRVVSFPFGPTPPPIDIPKVYDETEAVEQQICPHGVDVFATHCWRCDAL
jgi:hypothetical protein